MTQIDKGIPLPTNHYGRNIDLLKQLEIGDSIHFTEDAKRIYNSYYTVAKRLGIKIVIRKQQDGCRLWRYE